MILIILAAGTGSRLGKITSETPKVLIPLLYGKSLLDHHIEAVKQNTSVERVVVVSGFGADLIDSKIERLGLTKLIQTQFNPFYSIAGPVVSVWMASSWMTASDFLLCNGDTYYHPQAIARILDHEQDGIALGIDVNQYHDADEMKVILNGSGNLCKVSKSIGFDYAHGISTGLVMVKGSRFRKLFVDTVSEMMRFEMNLKPTMAWHNILNVLVENHIPVETIELLKNDWHEVDTTLDIQNMSCKLLDLHPLDE
jgi:L-glutamine-phosphate cytidylyltransferase